MNNNKMAKKQEDKVTKRIHGRLRDWGKAYFIGDVCIPKSIATIISNKNYPEFGEVVVIEIKEWFTQKDDYRPLRWREVDDNNNYINR